MPELSTKAVTINVKVSKLHQKIDIATAALQPYLNRLLKELPARNAESIAEYVLAMQTEINPALKHRKNPVMHENILLMVNALRDKKTMMESLQGSGQ